MRLLALLSVLLVPTVICLKVTVLFCGSGTVPELDRMVREVVDQAPDMQVQLVTQCLPEQKIDSPSTTTSNRLWLTSKLVCARLLNGSALVLLFQPDPARAWRSAFSAAAYALGFYRVPTIGANIKDTEFSRKNLYPTFLRTSPPHSDDAQVLTRVLIKLHYLQVVVVVVEGDENGEQFVARMEHQGARHKIQVQAYVKLHMPDQNEDEHGLAGQIVEQLAQTTSNTVLLCAKHSDAERIFAAARQFTGAGRVWLVTEAAARASNLPRGALSVQLQQSTESTLRDALAVARAGITHLLTHHADAASAPQRCAREEGGTIDAWTARVGMDVYRFLRGQTHVDPWTGARIRFDANGDRTGMAYAVLNSREQGPAKQGKNAVQVGRMTENGELELDERAIVWPGGQRRKPLEVTLPKHLRVSLVPDPPFVYALAVDAPARCAQMQTQRTPLEVDRVPVRGPWFPCTKRLDAHRQEMFCCSGMAVDLLAHLARGDTNSLSSGSDPDTGFSFDLFLNDSYGTVLVNGADDSDEHLQKASAGFRL